MGSFHRTADKIPIIIRCYNKVTPSLTHIHKHTHKQQHRSNQTIHSLRLNLTIFRDDFARNIIIIDSSLSAYIHPMNVNHLCSPEPGTTALLGYPCKWIEFVGAQHTHIMLYTLRSDNIKNKSTGWVEWRSNGISRVLRLDATPTDGPDTGFNIVSRLSRRMRALPFYLTSCCLPNDIRIGLFNTFKVVEISFISV